MIKVENAEVRQTGQDPVRFGKVTSDLLRISQSHGGSRKISRG